MNCRPNAFFLCSRCAGLAVLVHCKTVNGLHQFKMLSLFLSFSTCQSAQCLAFPGQWEQCAGCIRGRATWLCPPRLKPQ